MAHSKTNFETGITCPNCQTYFAHVEVERDADQAYAVLEVTPCAIPGCGVLLCACCSTVHTDCCGQTICAEHAVAVTSEGSARIDKFCPACYAEMVASEATPACCPECLSLEIVCVPYDFGSDPETGYREAGERFECRTCGASGDASEVAFAARPAAKPMGRETAAPNKFTQTA